MKRTGKRLSLGGQGFTLVELLIVIAVLSMLIAICVPSGLRAAAMARRALCAANLRGIGQAYPIYVTDHQNELEVLRDETWAALLLPYFNKNTAQYVCPDDIEPDWAWPHVTMRTDWLGGRDEDVFEIYPYWLEGDHNDIVVEGGKPKIWKVNDDVYQQMGSARQDMPQYTPGSNPKEYWYILEDIGDDDFYDFDLHVKEISPGIVEISGKHWANAHATHHIIAPDGEEILVLDEVGPFEYAVPPTSYGISSKACRIAPGTRKIIFLDYEEKFCFALDDAGPEPGWDQLQAPRHLGRANVLFADGGVESMSTDEINPEEVTPATELLWSPLAP